MVLKHSVAKARRGAGRHARCCVGVGPGGWPMGRGMACMHAQEAFGEHASWAELEALCGQITEVHMQ